MRRPADWPAPPVPMMSCGWNARRGGRHGTAAPTVRRLRPGFLPRAGARRSASGRWEPGRLPRTLWRPGPDDAPPRSERRAEGGADPVAAGAALVPSRGMPGPSRCPRSPRAQSRVAPRPAADKGGLAPRRRRRPYLVLDLGGEPVRGPLVEVGHVRGLPAAWGRWRRALAAAG